MRSLPVIILFLFTLSSCFEEDMLIQPHQPGNLKEGEAAQGSNYERQVFYDLNSNREVRSNLISDWDISFESSGGGWTIRLNSSKFMLAGNSNDTSFTRELIKSELTMKFDASHGDTDSTAIGSWAEVHEDSAWSLKQVYLLDRGKDENNKAEGLKKIRFDMAGNDYLVRFANPDNSGDTTIVIDRDPAVDCIHFSFEDGIVRIAPDPDQWSLLFSRYTTMLVTNEGEDYPYLVTGVLLNPNGVTATLDTIHDFSNIQLADTIDLELTTRSDVIGYEWKYYNFDAGVYTIEPGMAYVIRDREGFYYKFRFFDFYNDTGEKGHPRFEFVRL